MAGSSVGGRSGSARSGREGPEERGFARTLCGFWLGRQGYAIAAEIVGEVVSVESVTPVPLAPPAVVGLFNLRGTPVALVDLVRVLGLHTPADGEGTFPGAVQTALVLRAGELVVGALISRMEMVIPAGRGRFRPRSDSGEESALVEGFLEIADRGSLVMTVLSSPEIVARLTELRFRRIDEER